MATGAIPEEEVQGNGDPIVEVVTTPEEEQTLADVARLGMKSGLPMEMPSASVEASALMPITSVDDALIRYNEILEFTKRIMVEGEDYGEIPGCGGKPVLLKAGAEKLCNFFGFTPVFVPMNTVYDWHEGFFHVTVMCGLYKGGHLISTSFGSCNTKEPQYRYRTVFEWDATPEDWDSAVKVQEKTKRSGEGSYRILTVENKEPFGLVNTIEKMAQKRALVAVVLIACNVSKIYTQDIEDMNFVVVKDKNESKQISAGKNGGSRSSGSSKSGSSKNVPSKDGNVQAFWDYAYGVVGLTKAEAMKVLDDHFGHFDKALDYLKKSYDDKAQSQKMKEDVEKKPKVVAK